MRPFVAINRKKVSEPMYMSKQKKELTFKFGFLCSRGIIMFIAVFSLILYNHILICCISNRILHSGFTVVYFITDPAEKQEQRATREYSTQPDK